MSKNLPETQPSEEVDLGQLFKLIGSAFDRLFRFIGSIFNKLFLSFVWLVFFAKKHFIIIVIAGIAGVVLAVVKQKVDTPIYKSTIIIKQNYNIGEHFYNTLQYYNSLIQQKDSIAIGNILDINPTQAAEITSLEAESSLTENQKVALYDDYLKGLDSVLGSTITYKDFLENTKDYEHRIQRITLRATSKNNFNNVLSKIVENIEKNEFYVNERAKGLLNLSNRDSIIKQSLLESQSLQTVYKEVLKQTPEKSAGAATNITFEGAENKSTTKEYELYNNDLELRRELVEIARQKKNLDRIIEIVSNQNGEGFLDNKTKLFGFETPKIMAYGIKLALLMFIILLLIEFVSFLERYKDKAKIK